MSKIKIDQIQKGIAIAISAMQVENIEAEINIPDRLINNHQEDEEFIEMRGKINSDDLFLEFDFHLPVSLDTHRDSKNWAWIIVHCFLGEAINILRKKEGLNNKVKHFLKIEIDLIDKLIKNTK